MKGIQWYSIPNVIYIYLLVFQNVVYLYPFPPQEPTLDDGDFEKNETKSTAPFHLRRCPIS